MVWLSNEECLLFVDCVNTEPVTAMKAGWQAELEWT
jgi:hypothetical protein